MFRRVTRASLIIFLILFSFFQQTGHAETSFSLRWQNIYSIVQYQLPNSTGVPIAIASSQDGKIWVVEQAANLLVSFDPATKSFKEYHLPTQNSIPISVAVDGYGNVWVTELNGERLAELQHASSRIEEFAIPGINVSVAGINQKIPCGPTAVTPDQYGNIWFACLFSNQIDVFFPSNQSFHSFNLPVFQSGPAGLLLNNGKLWFTAADADMLGYLQLDSLKQNSSSGIKEFPPLNSTYIYSIRHAASFLGGNFNITSSLLTPTAITMSADGKTLWVTEHVDNSFDSYNIETQTLNKYWTSKTDGRFGYAYAFPNAVSIDNEGNAWIAEHYGNKIAVFSPNSMAMTEILIPCCSSIIAGAYSATLDRNGNLWFVETNSGMIGEVVKVNPTYTLSSSISSRTVKIPSTGDAVLHATYSLSPDSPSPLNITFEVSGITPDGNLKNVSVSFDSRSLLLLPGQNASVDMHILTSGLKQGSYFITVSAVTNSYIYSYILGLDVNQQTVLPFTLAVAIMILLFALSLIFVYLLLRRRSS